LHPDLAIASDRALIIVDVDEVLALFYQGFGRFIARHGYELRSDKFALFSNIFQPGATEHLEIETGRALFDEFFRSGSDLIDPSPGAPEALAALAAAASVVILTNAPAHGRDERRRWLQRHDMNYPMIINEGPKGPAIAAMASQTEGRVVFVDDIVSHLDSCAVSAPRVHRFQTVADPILRPLAPSKPEHPRIDGWINLLPAIQAELATVA
jgi:hypothetical protein